MSRVDSVRRTWRESGSYDRTVHLLFLDESGQLSERKLFALGLPKHQVEATDLGLVFAAA
jgi:hypothetical protein